MKIFYREHLKPFLKKPYFGFIMVGLVLLIVNSWKLVKQIKQ